MSTWQKVVNLDNVGSSCPTYKNTLISESRTENLLDEYIYKYNITHKTHFSEQLVQAVDQSQGDLNFVRSILTNCHLVQSKTNDDVVLWLVGPN